MKHVRLVSQAQVPALGVTTPLEELILLLFTAYFRQWDNFQSVFQNLQKFYSKT